MRRWHIGQGDEILSGIDCGIDKTEQKRLQTTMSRDQLFYKANGSNNSISSTPDFQQDDVTMDSTKGKYPDYCRTITITDSNGQLKELVFPKALDLDRPKRARTTFSTCQLKRLEVEFQKNQYMVGVERAELASELGLSETQVKVWFQNRRTKHKKDTSVQSTIDDVISPLPDIALSMSNASVFAGSNSSPLLRVSSLRMPSTTPTTTSQAAYDILPHSLMMTSLLQDSSSAAAAAAVAMATGAGLRNLPALYTTFGAFPQIPFSS